MKVEIDNIHERLQEEFETPETLAFEHAMDFLYAIAEQMEEQGITRTELAERMGVSISHLSQLFDNRGAMTMKTIAKFELAIGGEVDFSKLWTRSGMFEKASCRYIGDFRLCPVAHDWDALAKKSIEEKRGVREFALKI